MKYESQNTSATLIDVPLENAQICVLCEWLGSSFYINNILHINVLFFRSILNEQLIQWVQLDWLKKH